MGVGETVTGEVVTDSVRTATGVVDTGVVETGTMATGVEETSEGVAVIKCIFSSVMSSKYKVLESCTPVTIYIHLEEDTIFNTQLSAVVSSLSVSWVIRTGTVIAPSSVGTSNIRSCAL